MKHYKLVRWADYARNLVSPEERAEMEAHLEGCALCRRRSGTFEKIVPIANAEARLVVSEAEVRSAKAIFVLQLPERVSILPRLRSALLFDSFREPLPAGVRSQHRVTRQTLYHAGEYSLDLRLEHEWGSRRVILVGQIASRTEPDKAMAGVPVSLLSGNRVLARAVSNQFGEFSLDYVPQGHLQLHIPVRAATASKGSRGPRAGGSQ